jgi:hypothetical protein
MLNVTVGRLPAVPFETFRIWIVVPGSDGEKRGIACAFLMDASNSTSPCGMWQVAH